MAIWIWQATSKGTARSVPYRGGDALHPGAKFQRARNLKRLFDFCLWKILVRYLCKLDDFIPHWSGSCVIPIRKTCRITIPISSLIACLLILSKFSAALSISGVLSQYYTITASFCTSTCHPVKRRLMYSCFWWLLVCISIMEHGNGESVNHRYAPLINAK